MASCKRLFVFLLSVLTITLITEIGDVEGRGGRGGGGGRSGGSRGGSRVGSRSGSRGSGGTSRGNSISRSGSSPYTRSTFKTALTGAYIYNSARYMRSNRYRSDPNEMPTICTNNFDKDSNGTTYGYFICPRAGEPEDHDYCCGDDKREHCCEYDPQTGKLIGMIVGIIAGGFAISILIYCCILCVVKEQEKKEKIKTNPQGWNSNRNTTSTSAFSNAAPKKTTEFTSAATDTPYENKGFTGDSTTTPAYDNKTVLPYSAQPASTFTYSNTHAAPSFIGFENSDSVHSTPPPSYSQAVN